MISTISQKMSENDNDLQLNDNWCLWWRFLKNSGQKRYDASNLQEVFEFNSLDKFSQIYNGSPLGKVSKYMSQENQEKDKIVPLLDMDDESIMENLPIDCYMQFRKGISPEWEDSKNSKGGHFTVEFNKLEDQISDHLWKEISCNLVGEIWEHSEYVNGLRILYKQSQIIKEKRCSALIKFEIWIQIPKNEILNKNFKDIKEQEIAWNSIQNSFCSIIENALEGKKDSNMINSTNKPFDRSNVAWDCHFK